MARLNRCYCVPVGEDHFEEQTHPIPQPFQFDERNEGIYRLRRPLCLLSEKRARRARLNRGVTQMNMTFLYRIGTVCTLVLMTLSPGVTTAFGNDPKLDPAKLEKFTGMKGKLDEKEGVFKVSVPRTDLQINVAGVKMTPPLSLTP